MSKPASVRWPWLRWLLGALLLVSALAVLGLAWRSRAAASTPAEETIQFNHRVHVGAGVQCVFCHPGVLYGPTAGIPSLAKCVGCHQNVQVSNVAGQTDVNILLAHYEAGQPLRWPKVNDQPDFVYFSHRPHIAAGVYCQACHGDVAAMAMAQPAFRLNMGFCLACHGQQGAEKQRRLTGCATCHE